jgi:glutamate/tyrosine decarboxylase-like PLP-dependent enzyme
MDEGLLRDRDRLPELLAATSAYAAEVLASLDDAPVALPPSAPPRSELRAEGIGAEAALGEFRTRVGPVVARSAGPRYLGYVIGGGTPASILGDWLCSVFDANVVSEFDNAAALQLERDTKVMLRTLLGLPEEFVGAFVSGATMSNFVGLALAREWVGRAHGVRVGDVGAAGMPPLPVFAATPHVSSVKALSMLGVGRRGWTCVACVPGRESMDLAALQTLLAEAPRPSVVIASAGTVDTGDFDDFAGLAELKERHGFWLHVDGAFGGLAALSPELRPLLSGWECADSVCVDLHKWLNVPYDSAVSFTRHRDLRVDVFSSAAAYLNQPGDEPSPLHIAPESSHRWRALPAWFSLTAYGSDGHRDIVERDARLARELGARIERSDAFELLAPVRLNIVCFAVRGEGDAARRTTQFVTRVRDDGRALLTPTMLWGKPAVRAAFSNWRTTERDLDIVWEAMLAAAAAAADADAAGAAAGAGA